MGSGGRPPSAAVANRRDRTRGTADWICRGRRRGDALYLSNASGAGRGARETRRADPPPLARAHVEPAADARGGRQSRLGRRGDPSGRPVSASNMREGALSLQRLLLIPERHPGRTIAAGTFLFLMGYGSAWSGSPSRTAESCSEMHYITTFSSARQCSIAISVSRTSTCDSTVSRAPIRKPSGCTTRHRRATLETRCRSDRRCCGRRRFCLDIGRVGRACFRINVSP